ncbi:hypothetical protein BCR41DRAFT_367752 [Lobosporangium transversale]|uniref:Uncharacterized protein n=1 Tax=Lobosporangium transversale TaxID=64571 RepID=A0A1Y2H2W4_9FUNG|nr:hypothetical protein BCR41DRAFT_367752 [Lobosporangium transversale]ORZ27402.1 hypothetical protein BCR41DRAFT_367752 [Lobosporangium transversale]|eukprot:XP_021885129.1 hypothetical protein BCR41DRAFT_367752 [Lobosporangium transversale]
MALSSPIPLSPLHEMMEKESTTKFIPDVEKELEEIKVFLVESLKEVEDYLNKLTVSLYRSTTCELQVLTKDLLDIVERYYNRTLPDLCKIVDQIRALMTRYEHAFEVFVDEAKDTISSLQDLINMVPPLQRAHEEAANGFQIISFRAQDLIDKYNEASRGHTETPPDIKLFHLG